MSAPSFETASTKTSDGVTLRYITAGPTTGQTLIFVPGWGQTAIQWHKQISYFSSKYRVFAIDHRGHGDSDKPAGGYRISRLAADLNDFITQLELKDIVLINHSMGCAVIWSLWNTFADLRPRISKLVLVDQSPVMTASPAWEDGLAETLAAPFTATSAYEIAAGLAGPNGSETTTTLMRSLFSPGIDETDFAWTMKQVSKMSMQNSATLFLNHATQDWRDVLPTISVPTLAIGGEGSIFNPKGMEWIAKQIPGAKLNILPKDEGGSHFMFWENDKAFNKAVDEFLNE